jgi:hypothetical protein
MRFRAPAGEALVVHCNVGRERVEGDLARAELRPGHVLDEADAGRAQTRPSLRWVDEELGERHDALQGIRNGEVAAVVIQHDPDMADRRLGSRIGENPVEPERAPSIHVDELGDDGVLVVPASALELKLKAARRGVYRAPSAGFALFDQLYPVDRRVCPRAVSRRPGPKERKPEAYRTNRGDGILLGQH